MRKPCLARAFAAWPLAAVLVAAVPEATATGTPAEPEKPPRASELDRMVVTARRRPEPLLDVPKAVTAVGARLGQDSDVGRHGLRLELDARWRRDLGGDDPVLASFRGVPGVLFELPALRDPAAGELRLGLDGGIGAGTRWSLDYARDFGQRQDGRWMLGLHRAF